MGARFQFVLVTLTALGPLGYAAGVHSAEALAKLEKAPSAVAAKEPFAAFFCSANRSSVVILPAIFERSAVAEDEGGPESLASGPGQISACPVPALAVPVRK